MASLLSDLHKREKMFIWTEKEEAARMGLTEHRHRLQDHENSFFPTNETSDTADGMMLSQPPNKVNTRKKH